MNHQPIVESYAGHRIGIWGDTAELNYWARKIGIQTHTNGKQRETNFIEKILHKLK